MRVLNTAQMREADRRTIDDIGIPAAVLMENAGRQVVSAMESTFPDLPTSRVAVLCGRGNNGGDGYVAASVLQRLGLTVRVAADEAPRTPAASAARRGWQGDVELDLQIDGSGNLVTSKVRTSRGFEALDKQALEMVKKAAPFPLPPEALRAKTFNVIIPVSFKLE